MSKKISLGAVILCILLAILVTFNITYLAVNNKYTDLLAKVMADYDDYAKLSNVMQIIRDNYIGELDENAAADAILAGYIAGIDDPYARYMDAETYAEFLAEQSASMVGIGILAEYDSAQGAILVAYVMPDSPAETVGIHAGDWLVAVNGVAVSGITYAEATAMLKGEAGSTVQVSIIRDNSRQMEFTLTRAAVTMRSVIARLYTDAEGKDTDIGYVLIRGFDSQTPTQFREAISDLAEKGAKKFIFDLRGNPGGELSSVTKVLDSLLPEGLLVRMYDKDGKESTIESDSACMELTACVLVNKSTASAAELFTAALMDYTDKELFDATVIGTTTYGKGTVQSVFQLSDNTAISFSTKTYSPPYSDSYNGIGITPDVYLPLLEDAANVSIYLRDHQSDNQIQRAVEILNAK